MAKGVIRSFYFLPAFFFFLSFFSFLFSYYPFSLLFFFLFPFYSIIASALVWYTRENGIGVTVEALFWLDPDESRSIERNNT